MKDGGREGGRMSDCVLWEIKEERMEEVEKAWLSEGWWEWEIRDEREREKVIQREEVLKNGRDIACWNIEAKSHT